MLKAIRTFDTERGTAFSTYAVPLIMGEIRKFLRDDGMIKVNRQMRRNGAILMRCREEFMEREGREPHIEELANLTGLSHDEISSALDSSRPVASLSEQIGDDPSLTIENTVEDTEHSMERIFDRIALSDALERLPDNWRKIIILRYFRDYSQQQTADALGLSQVKVSREEKKIIAHLRENIV
jgi:RNA polymerase sporulation-specific sigma factor